MKEYKNELKEKKIEEKEKMFDMIKNEKIKFRNKAKELSFEIKKVIVNVPDYNNKFMYVFMKSHGRRPCGRKERICA